MSETVKRYDCSSGGARFCQGCYTMEECEHGDYVQHEDYARLEQECERLRADKAAIDLLNYYIVTAEHPETGKTAICADSGTLRDCMEAALSAKP